MRMAALNHAATGDTEIEFLACEMPRDKDIAEAIAEARSRGLEGTLALAEPTSD